MLQKDIPHYLQQHDISPSGLSSIEKRLNHIREVLNFTKNEQLVAFCKDVGGDMIKIYGEVFNPFILRNSLTVSRIDFSIQ